jgi:predicted nucleic acid-binding protein
LITLGRLAQLELLARLAEQVLVPRGVLAEVAAKDDKGWLAGEIERHPGFTIAPDVPFPPSLDDWELGRGECCVIAHAASQPHLIAVLDDLRARRAAKAFGLNVTGTLGILVRARRAGLIPRVSPLIAAMRDIGFYASDAVIRETLANVGEAPEEK